MIDDEAGGSGSDSEPDVPLRSLIPLTDKERADGMADLVDDDPDSEDDEFINDAPSRPMSPMDDESDSDFDDMAHLPARKQCISSLSPVPISPSDLFGTPPSPSKSPKRKNIRKNANKHNLPSKKGSKKASPKQKKGRMPPLKQLIGKDNLDAAEEWGVAIDQQHLGFYHIEVGRDTEMKWWDIDRQFLRIVFTSFSMGREKGHQMGLLHHQGQGYSPMPRTKQALTALTAKYKEMVGITAGMGHKVQFKFLDPVAQSEAKMIAYTGKDIGKAWSLFDSADANGERLTDEYIKECLETYKVSFSFPTKPHNIRRSLWEDLIRPFAARVPQLRGKEAQHQQEQHDEASGSIQNCEGRGAARNVHGQLAISRFTFA